jgi:hypothetical protein
VVIEVVGAAEQVVRELDQRCGGTRLHQEVEPPPLRLEPGLDEQLGGGGHEEPERELLGVGETDLLSVFDDRRHGDAGRLGNPFVAVHRSRLKQHPHHLDEESRAWEHRGMLRGSPVALRSVAPVFSTTDVAAWLEHYRELGFTVDAFDEEYGFASSGPVELHVSRNPGHDPRSTAGCAYLDVADADAVWQQWSAVPGGRTVEPVDTDYGTREGAHVDPDGNLLRFGSRR